MRNRSRESLRKTYMGSIGWLFADLLLALAMLFLVANTISLPKSAIAKPKVTPTATSTPTAPPRLEPGFHRFTINFNSDNLLNNDPAEQNNIIQQVKSQGFLQNRSAGLVIVYGGAPTTGQINTADTIANAIYGLLINLGKNDPRFARLSKYDPLYLLGGDLNSATLDIFLFAQ